MEVKDLDIEKLVKYAKTDERTGKICVCGGLMTIVMGVIWLLVQGGWYWLLWGSALGLTDVLIGTHLVQRSKKARLSIAWFAYNREKRDNLG